MNLLKKSYNLSHELTLYRKPTLSSDTIGFFIDNYNEEDIDEDFYLEDDVITEIHLKDNANIPFPLDVSCESLLDMILNQKADETLESINTALSVERLERFLKFYIDQRPKAIQNLEEKMEEDTRYLLFTSAVEYAENLVDRSMGQVFEILFKKPKSTEPLDAHPMLTTNGREYVFKAYIYLNDVFINLDNGEIIKNPAYIDFHHEKVDDLEPLGEITLRFKLDDEN